MQWLLDCDQHGSLLMSAPLQGRQTLLSYGICCQRLAAGLQAGSHPQLPAAASSVHSPGFCPGSVLQVACMTHQCICNFECTDSIREDVSAPSLGLSPPLAWRMPGNAGGSQRLLGSARHRCHQQQKVLYDHSSDSVDLLGLGRMWARCILHCLVQN